MTAVWGSPSPKELTMTEIPCPHCQRWFQFDPREIWASPGPLVNGKPEQKMAIQCANCSHWLITTAYELDLNQDDDPRRMQS